MKAAGSIPILMYHHVSPSPGLVTVSPQNFEAQMAWLAHAGWHTLGTRELEDFLAGKPVPEKSVMITFDDGYLDNWVYAFPLLRRYGLHAVVFLVTAWIGEGAARPHLDSGQTPPPTPDHGACKQAIASGHADAVMLRWSEVQAMQESGTIEFHSHSHTHVRWDRLYTGPERLQALAQDLETSRAMIATRLGYESRHLCWPWGHTEAGYAEVASQLGFDIRYGVQRGVLTPTIEREGNLPRLAARDRGPAWIARQCRLGTHPWLARLYFHVLHP